MSDPVDTARDPHALRAILDFYQGIQLSTDHINEYYDSSAHLYEQICGQAPQDHFVQQFTSSLAGKSFVAESGLGLLISPYNIFSTTLNNGEGCAEGSPGRRRFNVMKNMRGIVQLISWDENGQAQVPPMFQEFAMYAILHPVDLFRWESALRSIVERRDIFSTIRPDDPHDWIDRIFNLANVFVESSDLKEAAGDGNALFNPLLLLLGNGETELVKRVLTLLEIRGFSGLSEIGVKYMTALINVAASQQPLDENRRNIVWTALDVLKSPLVRAYAGDLQEPYPYSDRKMILFLHLVTLLSYPEMSGELEDKMNSIVRRVFSSYEDGETYLPATRLLKELTRFYDQLSNQQQLSSAERNQRIAESMIGRLIEAVWDRRLSSWGDAQNDPNLHSPDAETGSLLEAFQLLFLGRGHEIHSMNSGRAGGGGSSGPSGPSTPPAPSTPSTPPAPQTPQGSSASAASGSLSDWIIAVSRAVPRYVSTAIASAVSYVSSQVEYSYESAGSSEMDGINSVYAQYDEIYGEDEAEFDDQETGTDDLSIDGAPFSGAAELFEIPVGI